jgi:hypothetical protein
MGRKTVLSMWCSLCISSPPQRKSWRLRLLVSASLSEGIAIETQVVVDQVILKRSPRDACIDHLIRLLPVSNCPLVTALAEYVWRGLSRKGQDYYKAKVDMCTLGPTAEIVFPISDHFQQGEDLGSFYERTCGLSNSSGEPQFRDFILQIWGGSKSKTFLSHFFRFSSHVDIFNSPSPAYAKAVPAS